MTADVGSGAAGPVVIIGAARSGTKILRSMLAAHPSLSAVPYDVNYVWMARHQGRRDDELSAADATPAACRFIREYLGNFAAPGTRVVEKTVGNTLRVPFVDRVFPDAVYIHLVRDGRDVAASARVQWRRPAEAGTLTAKLRTFPLRSAWRYALNYAGDYLRLRLARRPAVRSWGPRYRGMLDEVGRRDLLDICADQWARSVARATADLAALAPGRCAEVRYEHLVADPTGEVTRLLAFLGLTPTPQVAAACAAVTEGNVGKWRQQLTPAEADRVQDLARAQLERWGYL